MRFCLPFGLHFRWFCVDFASKSAIKIDCDSQRVSKSFSNRILVDFGGRLTQKTLMLLTKNNVLFSTNDPSARPQTVILWLAGLAALAGWPGLAGLAALAQFLLVKHKVFCILGGSRGWENSGKSGKKQKKRKNVSNCFYGTAAEQCHEAISICWLWSGMIWLWRNLCLNKHFASKRDHNCRPTRSEHNKKYDVIWCAKL